MRVQRLYKNLIRQSAVDVVTSPDVLENEHDLEFPSEYPAGESLQDTDLFPEKDFFRPKKIEGDKEQSAILALLPTPEAAKEIANSVSDFEVDPDDLHITLVYIGKKLSEEEAEKLVDAITPLCESYDSLECRLQGLGLFDHENKDGNKPFYASVDAIGMAEFRSGLIQAMDEAGIEYAKDYDFIPHMTLAYTDPEKISLAEGSPGVEWSSNTVYLLNGEDKIEIGFGGVTKTAQRGLNLEDINQPGSHTFTFDEISESYHNDNTGEDTDLHLGDKEESNQQSFYLKQLDTVDGVDIWIVDGTEIRNNIDPDYVFGGHHYRYDWIPENEIWIDDDLGEDELDYTIQHELEERQLMVSEDMDYETAHDHALETEKEMRNEDQDKEGDVEAPYSSGHGPINVRFDDDKKYNFQVGANSVVYRKCGGTGQYDIVKGATNYLGQKQDIMITPEFKKMIKRMLDLGFDLSTRDKAVEILAFNAKGFDKIIDRLTDPQYDEIYTTLVTPETPVNKELPPNDPNELDPPTFDDEYSYNVSSPYEINPTLVDRNDADRLLHKINPKTKISMKSIIAQELASEAAINLLSTLFDLGFTVWNYRDAQIILSNLPTNSAAGELMAIPEVSWSTVIDAAMPQAQPQPSQQPQDQALSLRNKQLNLSLEEANEKFFPRPKYPTDMQQTDIPGQSVSPVQEAPQELTYATPLSISDPSKVRALNKQPLMQELANQYPSIIKKLPDEINVTSWGDSLKVPIRDKDGRTGPGKGRIANGGMFVRNNISKQEGMVVGASSEGLLYVITFPDTQLVQWDPKATDIRESHNQVKEVGMGEKEGVALPEGNPVDENKYQDYGRLDNSIPRPIENEDILYR